MDIEVFRRIGLTEGEIKTYLALLRLGESSIGSICREAKVSKSKLYDILDRLIDKGFVGYIIKNGTKYFSTSDPRVIMEYIQRKREELDQTSQQVEGILDTLQKEWATQSRGRVAEIYEGIHGLKTIREQLLSTLKKDDELLVLVAPKLANEKWEAWFMDFHKRREKRGVGLRIIYSRDAKQFAERRKQLRLTQVRYLPNDKVSPNWVDVYNDAILFVVMLKEPLSIVIRDKSLADSFRSYFDMMWNSCSTT